MTKSQHPQKVPEFGQVFAFDSSENFFVGLHDIFVVLAHFFRITAIHRNKQQGRTTLGSTFIGVDVSCERFQPDSKSIAVDLGVPNFDKVPTRDARGGG